MKFHEIAILCYCLSKRTKCSVLWSGHLYFLCSLNILYFTSSGYLLSEFNADYS